MEQNLTEFMKFFLEKHFFSSVLALIMTIITYSQISSDWIFVQNLGMFLFLLLSFLIYFVVITVIASAIKYIKIKRNEFLKNKEYEKEKKLYEEKLMKEGLESLWTIVDTFSNEDYELMLGLVNNKNNPIILDEELANNSWLLNSEWVHKTLHKKGETQLIARNSSVNSNSIPIERYTYTSDKYKYILVEDVYKVALISWKKYNKISHFEKYIV